MKKKDRKFDSSLLVRWLGTLISLGVMVFLLARVGWQPILAVLKGLSVRDFVAVLALVFCSRLATWGRWHVLLRARDTGIRPVETLKLTFSGLFASNVLPTTIGGDIARFGGAVRLGIDAPLAAASLVADRLIGMTGMTLVLPFALPGIKLLHSSANVLPNSFFQAGTLPFLGNLWQKLKDAGRKLWASLQYWIHRPLILLQALGFTLIHQLSIYLIIHILLAGMLESLSLWKIAGTWSLIYFITLLPISINGLGLQEVSISNLFVALGGVSDASAVALAMILRLVWLIGSLPGALFIGDILAGRKEQPVDSGAEMGDVESTEVLL